MREIHHRVKNNLQIISSILQLQARRIKDSEAQERFGDCLDRVHAIALLHESLHRLEDMARVDSAAYAGALVRQLVVACKYGAEMQYHADLGGAQPDWDAALPCGLILNELVTNALRHAFPDGRQGPSECVWQPPGNGSI